MKTLHHLKRPVCLSAFTRLELAIVVLLVVIVAVLVLSVVKAARGNAHLIQCNTNLKEVGLALKIWANDHNDHLPVTVSTNLGGSLEYAMNVQAFRHFLTVSNELGSPLKLTCPADSRWSSRDWSTLANNNLSYFISLDAEERDAGMFMLGDRHLDGGTNTVGNVLTVTAKSHLSWGTANHGERVGNIVLVDGSAHQIWEAELHKYVLTNAANAVSNRLEFP